MQENCIVCVVVWALAVCCCPILVVGFVPSKPIPLSEVERKSGAEFIPNGIVGLNLGTHQGTHHFTKYEHTL